MPQNRTEYNIVVQNTMQKRFQLFIVTSTANYRILYAERSRVQLRQIQLETHTHTHIRRITHSEYATEALKQEPQQQDD